MFRDDHGVKTELNVDADDGGDCSGDGSDGGENIFFSFENLFQHDV